MTENLNARFLELPDLLAGHLVLSVSAILVGMLVSIPVGILASRSDRLQGPVLTAAGLVQTVPSMALLALMVPLLGGTIGFLPAFIALSLYSILPTLRNTVTGLTELDPAVIEAARSVGMTRVQQLFRVELPLALPMIIAGIRTATVWVVGTATLSTPVGAPSLGNYIFGGLQTRNWVSVLFGCLFAAALAILLDRMILLLEMAVRLRSRRRSLTAALALAAILGAGLLPALERGPSPAAAFLGGGGRFEEAGTPVRLPLEGREITVGSKTFTEQYILANLLERHLQAGGATVTKIQNMGSTILFDAVRSSTVDLYVDYTGTIWTTLMGRDRAPGRTDTFLRVSDYLRREYGVLTVGRLGFENAYCLAMRREEVERLGLRSIADLARLGGEMSMGGDPEFFNRPDWDAVRDEYGLQWLRTRGMDSTFMYGALRDGEVDVIAAYTTDGRIAAYDLAVLEDPRQAFPPYDAILLLSPEAAGVPELEHLLMGLVNRIDDGLMREANRQVDLDGVPPEEAGRFLYEAIR